MDPSNSSFEALLWGCCQPCREVNAWKGCDGDSKLNMVKSFSTVLTAYFNLYREGLQV